MSEVAPDPIIAPDRSSLIAHTLPTVPRLSLLARALWRQDQHSRTVGQRQALALVADGGMGKSVLLGQLLDYIERNISNGNSDELKLSTGAVILIACASIPPGTDLSSIRAADEAFGQAADPLGKFSVGILGLLRALKSEYLSVTLLVDTLDLLVNEQSLPAVANLVAEALDIGDVVMTCRSYEFDNYLEDARQSAPRIAHRLTKVNLPRLDPSDIIAWATLYLSTDHRTRTQEDVGFLRALEGNIGKNGSLRQVCAVPVRLAITCETFASLGHVPEDLTVTGLYNTYWDTRVRREGGKSSTQASLIKERAALEISSHIVTPSGRILLQVPKGRVSDNDLDGVRLLVSEGIVRDLRASWEFFHQTFAEYAYAQWLLTKGIDSDEVASIINGLQSGRTNLWPIAGSLLLQINDYHDYLSLASALPVLTPEGARTQALAALRRTEDEPLSHLLSEVERDAESMLAVLPVLSDSPTQHLETAFNVSLVSLRRYPVLLASAATSTLGLLVSRAASTDAARFLTAAMAAVVEVRPNLPSVSWEQLPANLITPLVDSAVVTDVLPVIRKEYSILGVQGRQLAIQAHLDHPLSAGEVSDFANRGLGTPCPPLKDNDPIRLLQLLWDCSAVRRDRGWHTWRELLADSLPKGWNDVQLKFVVDLADQHESVRTEILGDLITGNVQAPVSYVNVFKALAAIHPIWIADWLLSRPTPREPLAIGGIAQGAEGLARGTNSATRMRLISWLTPGRDAAPRNVWAAQITLAGGSMPAHQQIFYDLISSGEPRQVVDSAIDAWLFKTPRHVLNEMTSQLRSLLQSSDADTLRTRARLEGRLADEDETARKWVERAMMYGRSPRVAGTSIKTFADAVRMNERYLSSGLVSWLGALLSTVHIDAARRIAIILADQHNVEDATLLQAVPLLASQTLNRMRLAVQQAETSQLSRALLELLVRLDIASPLKTDDVLSAYEIIRSRLRTDSISSSMPRADDQAASIRDLSHLCGTLMAKRLPPIDIRTRIGEVLSSIDFGLFGSKTGKAISSMLVGIGYRDPEAASWMEELFGDVKVSLSVKRAIADAFLRLDGDHVGGRASQLKDRRDCPQAVATYIIGKLHS